MEHTLKEKKYQTFKGKLIQLIQQYLESLEFIAGMNGMNSRREGYIYFR